MEAITGRVVVPFSNYSAYCALAFASAHVQLLSSACLCTDVSMAG